MSAWGLAWSIGRRELDWKFKGLRLLFVSLLLGVAALATDQRYAELHLAIDLGLGHGA